MTFETWPSVEQKEMWNEITSEFRTYSFNNSKRSLIRNQNKLFHIPTRSVNKFITTQKLNWFFHPDFLKLHLARTRTIHFNLLSFSFKLDLVIKTTLQLPRGGRKFLHNNENKTLNFVGRYIFFCTINIHSPLTRRSRSTAFLPVLRDAHSMVKFSLYFKHFSSRASHNAFYSFHDRKRNGEKFLFLRGEKISKKIHRQSRTRFQSLKYFIEIFSWVH